jgi:small subunit ribosomal protein S2
MFVIFSSYNNKRVIKLFKIFMSDISLSQLLEAGVHFGHKAYRWNPKMFPYIYSEVNNIHILDLVQSATLLKEANSYLEKAASEGKTFLFVGTKRQATTLIAQEAKRADSYYVNHRWLGGMLTNWTTVKERIAHLKDLEKQEADGTFDLLSKKEVAVRRKELSKLRKHLGGIKTMLDRPDVAIIIDQKREMTAIAECRKLGIPIVSILDTNCDPDLVDIPIPGNDDAVRSIKLILNSLTDSILRGQSKIK